MPTVSIIIPAYNPGTFLREALESIHAQTYTDWELVIVDDNSSEDLSWIKQDFPRANYIRQGHGGASVARNNGILNSSGEFIAFMDQDDLWRPHKLERQVAALLKATDAALCYCDLELITAEYKFETSNAITGTGQPKEHPDNAVEQNYSVELDGTIASTPWQGISNLHKSIQFFSSQFIVPSTTMLRRSALATSGLLDPFIPFSGDYDLLIKLGARHKVIRLASVDVLYRKHSNNFSDQYQVGRQEVEALTARYVAYAKSKGDRLLARDAKKLFSRPRKMYAAQAFDCARRSLRSGDYKACGYHFMRSLWFNPIFVLNSVTISRFSKLRK